MIAGLELAKSLGAEVVEAKCDSLLVVNQVNGTFEVKEERMQRYLDKLHVTLHRFREWTLQHVPQDQNSEADALANLGSSVGDDKFNSGMVVQLMKSVVEEGHAEINLTSLIWDWRNKYTDYLKIGKLPSDPKESRVLYTKAARFSLSEDGTLFRRAFDGPLAIFLGQGDTEYILREVHEGTCENHSGAESLVRKIIRAEYYWIDMEKDAKEFVRKWDEFERHASIIRQPGEPLHSVLSPWPFMKWGMSREALKEVHAWEFDLSAELKNVKRLEAEAKKLAYPEDEEDSEGSDGSEDGENSYGPGDEVGSGEDQAS
ncbi:uncharacterized protein [Nicotiana tomentosiformis]|uniref:uncharacterized protein n=1 Tax=Nicotiana tomentosiformis TaxID=4098 RepID=UPI00388C372B